MYRIITTNRFEKSLKKCIKRGLNVNKLKEALKLLSQTGSLPAKYRPHKLVGKYVGKWECHIEPDWLLVWDQDDMELTLLLIDTGSHASLFG